MSARTQSERDPDVRDLAAKIAGSAAHEAIAMIAAERDETVARTLEGMNPSDAVRILWELPDERRARVLEQASPEWAQQWTVNCRFPEDAIGRLMGPSFATFPPEMTVGEATAALREIVKRAFVSYAYVIDRERKLIGVLVFREMMFAHPTQALSEVMIRDPFHLTATTPVMDAMREVLKWHHPAYPVCDDAGRLVGVIRGQTLFEQQAFELSAQPGSMVGIQKEERLATPWPRSLRFRHPWLQLNLLTAFLAAAIVGVFQGTIDRIVILAVFLPVLAGQSGNTGCQTLAVTLRGMTLGELRPEKVRTLILKEAWLGILNGALVGATTAVVMVLYATLQHVPSAWTLGGVVAISMTIACMASGVSGVLVPMALRRMGADPVTASSIFLTTATDCTSMGVFLGLATLLVR